MNKKCMILCLILLSVSISALENPVIKRITYKKTRLNYDNPVTITVYLEHMNVKEVIVYFNNQEIKSISTNFTTLLDNDKTFYPSFNFEVNNIRDDNILKVFVVLSHGITVSADSPIQFIKGMVVKENSFYTLTDKIFFVKVGPFPNDTVFYHVEIDNDRIIKKIDEIISDDILYYKIKTIKTGIGKVTIFKYDLSIDEQMSLPVKTVKVVVK